jgi:hypothetical protein
MMSDMPSATAVAVNEFNFFKSTQDADKDLFFGPIDGETFVEIKDGWIMAHVLAAAGIFPSVSQARNNGYNKPIAPGFSDQRFGKKKTRITIFMERTDAIV